MSGFSSLNTAVTALMAQQRALEVTGQNIANVNTDGYTRQRVRMAANAGPATPALFAKSSATGEGVTVEGVDRMNDAFLSQRVYTETGKLSSLTGLQDIYNKVQATLGEPGDTGLQSQMSAYWSAWGDVANQPQDSAAREQLLEAGRTVAGTFNTVHGNFESLWNSQYDQLKSTVNDVNATAASVAKLNQAILTATQSGLSPNEMMDQRDQLVTKLAQSVGVTAKPMDGGVVNVYLNGTALVQGSQSKALTVTGSTNLTMVGDPSSASFAPVTVSWQNDTVPLNPLPQDGSIGAMLTTLNGVIPTNSAALDGVAQSLAKKVNDAQAAGYDQNGAAGTAFFVASNTNPLTAQNISVGLATGSLVAASTTHVVVDPTIPTYAGDNGGDNALNLSETAGSASSPDATYRNFIVQLGVNAQTVNQNADTQTALTKQVTDLLSSSTSVNLDEEMANMLAFQQAYTGAAKYLSTVNDTLTTLMNLVQ